MKRYAYIDCDYLSSIQSEVVSILNNKNTTEGWNFLNKLDLKHAPSVIKFCKELKLVVQNFSITVLRDDLELHIDALPQVAKINIPVSNTQGWSNVWYGITDKQLESCPPITVHGSTHEDVSALSLPEIDRIDNLDRIIAFNSRVPHSVLKNTPATLPRIVASLTFINQPLELLH